jgi:hypothetical protein
MGRVESFGFRVQRWGFRVEGLLLGVQGAVYWFIVWGLGWRGQHIRV